VIKIDYQDGGAPKYVLLLAESLKDLGPMMPKFSAWMRKEIQAEFESGGDGKWAPRKDVSQARYDAGKAARIAKIQAGRYGTLSRALTREKKRAEKRLARTPSSKSALIPRRQASVQRYEAQIAEVARLTAGAAGPATRHGKRFAERIARREVRAQQRIEAVERGDLLGAIASSMVIEWSKDNWEMASRIPWAGVHNDGGTANNGAVIPRRTFLEWTPERVEMFAKMANDYILERAAKQSA
jgi:hypothetical protein